MSLKTQVWTSFEECEAVVRPLLEAHSSSNPFLTFDWLKTHWVFQGSKLGARLLLIGLYRGETLVCFAPFRVRRNWLGVPRITFVGNGLSDFLGFAGEVTPENVKLLIEAAAIEVRGAYFYLPDILEGSDDDVALSQPGLWKMHSHFRVFTCPLRRIWPPATTGDSPSDISFQKRIPKYLKRLKMLGDVEFRVFDFDQETEAGLEMLPQLFRLEELRHAGTMNIWATPQGQGFLRSYLTSSKRRNMLALVILLDGIPIGFHLGFLRDRVFLVYVLAFHPAFAKFRVGHINCHLLVDGAQKLGIDVADFSKGDYFAKKVWANDVRYSGSHLAVSNWWPLACISLAGRIANTRLRVWVRNSGLTAKIKAYLRKTNAEEGERVAAQIAPTAIPEGIPPGEIRQLRYRDFCDLPVSRQAAIVQFVFEHGQKEPVWFTRDGSRLNLHLQAHHKPAQEVAQPVRS